MASDYLSETKCLCLSPKIHRWKLIPNVLVFGVGCLGSDWVIRVEAP